MSAWLATKLPARVGGTALHHRNPALNSAKPVHSHIVIASRESRLALWQAEHVRSRLMELYPQSCVEILGMTTRGDQILDRPLSAIGGKGLFIKELEVAMQEGRADLAVHSMKDLPMEMPDGFVLAAISARENPCDAFVSNRFAELDELPARALVGTSSLRREAILRAGYPQLVIRGLRGNLDTRLRKLDAGEYDAIILAAAGLIRLGLAARIRSLLTPEQSLPAPGQGVLGVEVASVRADIMALLGPLNDHESAHCVRAERAFSRALGGSCQLPLAAYAVLENGRLWLRGFIATPDGRQMVAGDLHGAPEDDESIGRRLAQRLREQGADAILEKLAVGQ
ncbi:MAG: hydroxymethylbilane synthase [Candidatus Accumulibacter sp.]|nr:hydroxymethylbilane synthase [Accumulibacter sp.]